MISTNKTMNNRYLGQKMLLRTSTNKTQKY